MREDSNQLYKELDTAEEMVALDRLKGDDEYFDGKRGEYQEKIGADCKALHDELEKLVNDGRKLVGDSEAAVGSYLCVSDSIADLIKATGNLNINDATTDEVIFKQLWELIEEAKVVQAQLVQRAHIWEEFVKERDSAVEELNDIRKQICEIEERGTRRFDKMLDDLEALKVLYLRWSFLANVTPGLLSLSSQLHPLASAQRESKKIAEEASELEKNIENLLDSLSAEFKVREEIVHSLLVISNELDEIENVLGDKNVSTHLRKELQQQLKGIRVHLNTLDQDIVKYNDNRMFLREEEEIATTRNFERLGEIEEKLKRMKLTTEEEEYDIDSAAEVLAAIYPDDHPRDILREQGIPFDDDLYLSPGSATSDDDDKSKFKTPPDDEVMFEESEGEDTIGSRTAHGAALSPIPDDPSPGLAMLVLLLGAACLVPHCDNESCCQLLNNFARSLDPSLEFLNGPPPF
ncbi:unnamed protein product [Litomosoides sigmodontis]|uniref:KASH domain-containing protein n=1 Tax=Litomosoides sigmodontis TaxID=42156 RepID=A0A3P7M5A9_LITSI|nr:unnamed protein product [Litomosoides sigmodontis]